MGTAVAEDEDRALLTALLAPTLGDEAGASAARLLAEFGSLRAVLSAAPSRRLDLLTHCDGASRQLDLIRTVILSCLRKDVETRPVFPGLAAVTDYLLVSLADEPSEQFHVLYLDARNHLLRDEILGYGTIDVAAVYPREVLRRAFELGATSMILAHNHPSGDATPSRTDLAVTRRLAAVAREVGIVVHDHIVVSRAGCASMRGLGLL